jgi:hypothetical protein
MKCVYQVGPRETGDAERFARMALKTMANSLESESLTKSHRANGRPTDWLKVAAVAAATALAGGLAAAWWYRSVVKKLHEADEIHTNPHFGIPGDDPADED